MSDTTLADCGPIHILIVEDDPFMAELSSSHYRKLGLSLDVAVDGRQALAMMEERRPDVVLCDRKMPEMNGSDLLRTVRSRGEEWQKIVFIFVTGLTDRRDRYALIDLKPDGYICKPIDYEKTDRLIASKIAEKRGI